MIINAFLIDPCGIELFSAMLSAEIKQVPSDKITHLFASHQDPDEGNSLKLDIDMMCSQHGRIFNGDF